MLASLVAWADCKDHIRQFHQHLAWYQRPSRARLHCGTIVHVREEANTFLVLCELINGNLDFARRQVLLHPTHEELLGLLQHLVVVKNPGANLLQRMRPRFLIRSQE